jgi:hypothetical protein
VPDVEYLKRSVEIYTQHGKEIKQKMRAEGLTGDLDNPADLFDVDDSESDNNTNKLGADDDMFLSVVDASLRGEAKGGVEEEGKEETEDDEDELEEEDGDDGREEGVCDEKEEEENEKEKSREECVKQTVCKKKKNLFLRMFFIHKKKTCKKKKSFSPLV